MFYPSTENQISGNFQESIAYIDVEITQYNETRHLRYGEMDYHKNGPILQLFNGSWAIDPVYRLHYRKNRVYVPMWVEATGFKLFMRPYIKSAVSVTLR